MSFFHFFFFDCIQVDSECGTQLNLTNEIQLKFPLSYNVLRASECACLILDFSLSRFLSM